MFAAGAGEIGKYRECSFRSLGTGTFFGTDQTNPAIGQKGRREQVAEWRLEVICQDGRVDDAIAAMRRAHSYEEPAFDVIPLRKLHGCEGEGRIGHLSAPMALCDLVTLLRSSLKLISAPVQVVGDLGGQISRVAIACGAGGEFLHDAIASAANAFITGEMRFHDYLIAKVSGISLVLPGHYATEIVGAEWIATSLRSKFHPLEVQVSQRETDPVAWS